MASKTYTGPVPPTPALGATSRYTSSAATIHHKSAHGPVRRAKARSSSETGQPKSHTSSRKRAANTDIATWARSPPTRSRRPPSPSPVRWKAW